MKPPATSREPRPPTREARTGTSRLVITLMPFPSGKFPRFISSRCAHHSAPRGGQAAAVVEAMPPKKSKEEQKLAGKLKLEAFKRQRAEAKAAKASAGDVAISDASNATESSEAKGDADAASKADARAPDAPPPRVTDPPAPVMEARAASTWTAATAAPFADVAPRSPPEEKIAAPLADVASSSVARAEPSSGGDGSAFQSLPGSSPGSPSPSFGDLGAEPRTAPDALRTHLGEAREAHLVTSLDEETENADVASLERCLLYTSPSPRDRTRSRMPSSA